MNISHYSLSTGRDINSRPPRCQKEVISIRRFEVATTNGRFEGICSFCKKLQTISLTSLYIFFLHVHVQNIHMR